MNENFIKAMWQQDENGNQPTGFAVMAHAEVRGSMMAAAIVARSVVSVMERQIGRERAKNDMLNMIKLALEADDTELEEQSVTIMAGRKQEQE